MDLYSKLYKHSHNFKRFTGITQEEFSTITSQLKKIWKKKVVKPKIKSGRPYQLGSIENQLLCLLLYYRTYATQLFLGFFFRANAATICRTIRRLEPLVAKIVAIKKERHFSQEELKTILLDCTEQPIQRPKHKQRDYYSGKKKRHTIKTEIQVTPKGRIINISKPVPGKVHDFELRKQHDPLPANAVVLTDSGYQGLQKIHSKTCIPIRKSRGKPRTIEERNHNRILSQQRIKVEHVIGHIKKFGIIRDVYRNQLSRYHMTFNIIAGIVNLQKGF